MADLSVRVSFWLVAAVMLLWFGINLAVRYEAALFPVVRNFHLTDIAQQHASVLLSGRMKKVRACRYLGLVLYVGDYRDPDAPRERLYVRFLDQPSTGDPSREPGYQSWGPWEVMRPEAVTGPHVWARVTHRCNPLYETSGVYMVMEARDLFEQTPP